MSAQPNPIIVDMEVVADNVPVSMQVATQYDLPIDLQTLQADHNGDYSAPAGTAWDRVEVDVDAPSGTVEINTNGTHDVAAYASADVQVPNSYSAQDEGKVVDNGALVAQTDETVTTNGVVNTTTVKQVTVNVQEAEDKDINFYDVDGVRLFSYTRDEFAALSALPTAPNRPDLFLNFTMWNWTKAEIDAQPGYVEVGALYDLTDCDFALVVEPTVAAQKDATLRFYTGTGNTVKLDWGDGSAVETYNASSTQIAATHTWPELGRRYRIKLTRKAGTSRITLGGAANANLLFGTHNDYVSQASAKELFFGSNCTADVVCSQLAYLYRYILCTNAIKKQTALNLKPDFPLICSRECNYNAELGWSTGYKTIITAGNTFLPGARANGYRFAFNKKLTIPSGTTALGARACMDAIRVETLHIPNTVASLGDSAVTVASNNYVISMREVWFYSAVPPTLTASSSLSLRGYVRLIFPFAGLADYLEETNWPGISQPSLAFATYNDGATLPTTDTTQGYNVTWYASKDDAINERNPITIGNGKRIFCTIEEVTP